LLNQSFGASFLDAIRDSLAFSCLLDLGVYAHTFVYERKEDCPVCTATVRNIILSKDETLNQLIQQLCEGDLRLKAPSLTTTSKTLYMQKPPALEKATRANLDKAVSSLVAPGEEISVTDPLLESINLALSVTFTS
jgi:ubiquitin-activating enzyme E1 C